MIGANRLRRRVLNNPKSSKKNKNEAWKKYFEWLNNNTFHVDVRKLFSTDEKGNVIRMDEKTSEKEKARIMKELNFSEEKADELIENARKKYLRYSERLKGFLDEVNALESSEGMDAAEKETRIQDWKIENSPESYLKDVIDGVKDVSTKKTFSKEGFNYIEDLPAAFDKKGNETEWYDDNYKAIEKDPAMKEFYDFFKKSMVKYMKYLPQYATDGLQPNFIPEVARSMLETLSSEGMRGSVAGLGTKFIDSIAAHKDSETDVIERDDDGNPLPSIPIRYVNDRVTEARREVNNAKFNYSNNNNSKNLKNLREAEDRLKRIRNDKSRDLVSILNHFALMALNYKHMSKVEDIVLIANRIMGEASEIELDSKGKRIKKKGNLLLQKRTG